MVLRRTLRTLWAWTYQSYQKGCRGRIVVSGRTPRRVAFAAALALALGFPGLAFAPTKKRC